MAEPSSSCPVIPLVPLKANLRLRSEGILLRSLLWGRQGQSCYWPASVRLWVNSLVLLKNKLMRGEKRIGQHYAQGQFISLHEEGNGKWILQMKTGGFGDEFSGFFLILCFCNKNQGTESKKGTESVTRSHHQHMRTHHWKSAAPQDLRLWS
jgi:hypothetical protein